MTLQILWLARRKQEQEARERAVRLDYVNTRVGRRERAVRLDYVNTRVGRRVRLPVEVTVGFDWGQAK